MILYKYMKFDTFSKYIDRYLKGEVYFADRSELNDPMEAVSLSLRMPLKKMEISERKSKEKEFYSLLGQFKICSMSSRADNFAMWTHYADNHMGVCIAFSIDPIELVS